jgi:hypothetical protein
MLSFPKALMAVGAGVFLLGLVLFLALRPPAAAPPVLAERSQKLQAQVQDPFPSVETLSGPWFRIAPVAIAPLPKPAAVPPRLDSTSVVFLGSSKDRDGTPTFFFKFAPSGQAIILKLGETKKGWTLKAVSDQKFTLLGAGGQYEVAR